jgi:hypothetical protein
MDGRQPQDSVEHWGFFIPYTRYESLTMNSLSKAIPMRLKCCLTGFRPRTFRAGSR